LGIEFTIVPAALRTQMRQGGADDLDRADDVGVDLTPYLVVAYGVLRGAEL
jgi:hypothetical protein